MCADQNSHIPFFSDSRTVEEVKLDRHIFLKINVANLFYVHYYALKGAAT